MHNIYFFLFSEHDFNEELAEEGLGEECVHLFKQRFLEGSHYENEWYTIIALIASDGHINTLVSPEDAALLGYQEYIKQLVDLPTNKRLPIALRLAVEVAATEMRLYGCHSIYFGEQNEGDKKIIASDRETLIKDIMVEIPRKLSQLYSEAISSPRSGQALDDYSFKCRLRKELATQFEEFCESTVPGFTTNCKAPYVRCFDLRNDNTIPENEDELMVMFVDIHT